jgi:hypothetical protein
MSERVSKAEIVSSTIDTQKVSYTFTFAGYKSVASYTRVRTPHRSISVIQTAFESNWDFFPKPIYSHASYEMCIEEKRNTLHYAQFTRFDKQLQVWDELYARIVLSQLVHDLEKMLISLDKRL